jgi:hypothetical protein
MNTGGDMTDDGAVQEWLAVEVINEFATVRVRKVETRNGARLEISSQRLGYTIQLDAMALESLTWQPMETFSRFLETPLGPPGDEH